MAEAARAGVLGRRTYFTAEFWDARVRGDMIQRALAKGMSFYQTASISAVDRSRILPLSQCKDNVDTAAGEWDIDDIIYFPEGIDHAGITDSRGNSGCFFSGSHRPKWAYRVTNRLTHEFMYIGPECIKGLFPDRHDTIDSLRRAKEERLGADRLNIRLVWKYQALLPQPLDESRKGILSGLYQTAINKPGLIGGTEVALVRPFAEQLENAWSAIMPDVALNEFDFMRAEITRLYRTITGKRKTTNLLTPQDLSALNRICSALEAEPVVGKPDRRDIDCIVNLYRRLRFEQEYCRLESLVWGARRTTAVGDQQALRTPAYHANLHIAGYLTPQLMQAGNAPVLDIGANRSVLYRAIMQKLPPASVDKVENIIDLEQDRGLYDAAPNPKKICASIAGIPDTIDTVSLEMLRGMIATPGQFKALVASFVFDQLSEDELRKAILACDHALAVTPKEGHEERTLSNTAQLIIALPEHSPVNKLFITALKVAGFEVLFKQTIEGSRLTDQAEKAILNDAGKDTLQSIREILSKPAYILCLSHERPADKEAFARLGSDHFVIRRGRPKAKAAARPPKAEVSAPQAKSLNDQQLLMLDVLYGLDQKSFQTQVIETVSRDDIMTQYPYIDFELEFAALSCYREFLSQREEEALDDIRHLWDTNLADVLTRMQVDFIMQTPYQVALNYADIRGRFPHLAPYMQNALGVQIQNEQRRIEADEWAMHRIRGIPFDVGRVEKRLERFKKALYKGSSFTLDRLILFEEEYRRDNGKVSIIAETRPRAVIATALIRQALKRMEGKVTFEEIAALAGLAPSTLSGEINTRFLINEENKRRQMREPHRHLLQGPKVRPKDAVEAVREALRHIEGKTSVGAIAERADVVSVSPTNYRALIDEENQRRQREEPGRRLIIMPTRSAEGDIKEAFQALEGPIMPKDVAEIAGVDPSTVRRYGFVSFLEAENERRTQEQPGRALLELPRESVDVIREAMTKLEGYTKLADIVKVCAEIEPEMGITYFTVMLYDYRAMAEEENMKRERSGSGRPAITFASPHATNVAEKIQEALKRLDGRITTFDISRESGLKVSTVRHNDYRKHVYAENMRRKKEEPERPLLKVTVTSVVSAVQAVLRDIEGKITQRAIARMAGVVPSSLVSNDCRELIRDENRRRQKEEPKRKLICVKTDNAERDIREALRGIEGLTSIREMAREALVNETSVRQKKYRLLIREENERRQQEEAGRPLIVEPGQRSQDARGDILAVLRSMEGLITMMRLKHAGIKDCDHYDWRSLVDEENERRRQEEPARPLLTSRERFITDSEKAILRELRTIEGKITAIGLARRMHIDPATLTRNNYRMLIRKVNAHREKRQPGRPLIKIVAANSEEAVREGLMKLDGAITIPNIAEASGIDKRTVYTTDYKKLVSEENERRQKEEPERGLLILGYEAQVRGTVGARWSTPLKTLTKGHPAYLFERLPEGETRISVVAATGGIPANSAIRAAAVLDEMGLAELTQERSGGRSMGTRISNRVQTPFRELVLEQLKYYRTRADIPFIREKIKGMIHDTGFFVSLFSDRIRAELEEERVYILKYDVGDNGFSQAQREVLELYVKVLSQHAHARIVARPFSREKGSRDSLLAVYCESKDHRPLGEGHVDVLFEEGGIKENLLKITGMLNIVFAAASIPIENPDESEYGRLVGFIAEQYKNITGKELAVKGPFDASLEAIRHLTIEIPKACRLPVEGIEEFYRQTREALVSA
ncbi:MAG: hypothetical protein PHS37_03600 [Candidatus Omnitrophica bacterium]|nr:hypothetical protein [Candidatus Omnitrophota bacterium]